VGVIVLALPPNEPPNRLRRIGRIVSIGSLVCAAAMVASIPILWSNDHLIHRWVAWPSPLGMKPITIHLDTRLLGALLSFVGASPLLYALAQLSLLFSAFARGLVFEDRNAARIRAIGIALLIKTALSPLIQILTTLNLTINNPPTSRLVGFELEVGYLMTVLGGLALMAFASVMREAARLSSENRGFV
jgi:DUF2975 family protein